MGRPSIVGHLRPACSAVLPRGVAMPATGVANRASSTIAQYDLGSPSAFSAMKFRIICGLTGAMRGM